MFAKWSEEKAGDTKNPMATYGCGVGTDQDEFLCGSLFPGGSGDFERQKMAAAWLTQNTRALQLHAAIAGAVPQLHHALGFVYGATLLQGQQPNVYDQQESNSTFGVSDNFNRIDVDSGISLSSRTADPVGRRATIQAFAATSAALEGSAGGQLASLPDTASTATRFEWGNAPPGTAGNWDATSCSSANAYEDPGCSGPRNFVQYTYSTASNASSLALIEGHVPSYYGSNNGALTDWSGYTQPVQGNVDDSWFTGAYSEEVSAYASAGYTVTTSQEAFLGPGQRAGTPLNIPQSGGYSFEASQQRGPALVATSYSSNGVDPTAIAHDLVGLSDPNYSGSYNAVKGGGFGDEPFQNVTYNPAEAADILKTRFVDKSNALGVNLTNGTIGYTAPAKIDVGNGGFPYELTAQFEWGAFPDNTHQTPTSTIAPRPGWTTNWNNNLAMSGSGMEAMGKSDARAAVGTIAAFMAAQDIYKASPSTQRDVAGLLTQAWWARQMVRNVVTTTLGSKSQQFLSLPQGVTLPSNSASWFTPGPSETATLAMTNAPVAWENRTVGMYAPYQLSRGWDYTGSTNSLPVTFTVTNAHGDQQNFGTWHNVYWTSDTEQNGYAQGFELNTWTFPQGVTIHLVYGNPWDPDGPPGSGDGFNQLTQVYNTFGTSSTAVRTININSDTVANLTGFSDTNGRSVSLGYSTGVIGDSMTDPAGAVTSFVFQPEQQASSTCRPVPFVNMFQIFTAENTNQPNTEYDWDCVGRVADVMDAEALQVGDRAPYEFYIADGTRGERDDPLGDAWSVVYDVYGHPSTYTDEDGNITTDVADGRGRVVQTTYPELDCEVFGFDDFNNTLSYSKIDKVSSCNVNAGASHVLSIAATWDPTWNKPLTIKDAMGNTTTFTYEPTATNGTSEMATAVRPAVTGGSPTYTFTYDTAGKVLTATDPITSSTSITTQNAYSTDGLENLVSTIVDPGATPHQNLTTTFGYDAIGNMSWTMDPRQNTTTANGQVVSYDYDLDRRKLETDHHDRVLTANVIASNRTIYDAVGRDKEDDVGTAFSGTTVTTWTMAKKTTYTPTSNVASVTDGDNRVTSTIYDSADRPSIVTDPVLRQSQKIYDAAGNTLQEIHGLGTPNQMTYATYTYATGTGFSATGGDGEKLSVYDADGSTHITTYAYDGFNRLITATYPDSTTDAVTSFDANSNMLTRTNRSGKGFTYTYDVLNRMLTEVDPAYGSTGANTITTGYDLDGRVTGVSDTFGNTLTPGYDTAGRQTQVANVIPGLSGTKTTKYKLDANGNRTRLTWPDTYYVTYGFDSMNRMVSASAGGSTLASYSYDDYSRRTNLAYLNGASIAYTYSPGSDLLTLTDGFVTTTNNAPYTLGYTNAHQLASETVSNNAYDFGPPNTTGTASYTAVNTLNQYPSITPMGGSTPPNSGTNCQGAAQAMSYDCDGNLTFDGVNTYGYDPKNRLMTVANGGTSVANYAYDPFGRRETKTVGSTITNFLNAGHDEIAEYDSGGDVLRRFVPGPTINEPVAYEDCSGATLPNCTGTVAISYYHTDHHGSVVAMSESNGNPASGGSDGPFTYDPFGVSATVFSGGQPFHYVGMYYDAETGCYYDRARYYCPALGRFLQTDPVGYKDDLDAYTYVGNDPEDRVDPTGETAAMALGVLAGTGTLDAEEDAGTGFVTPVSVVVVGATTVVGLGIAGYEFFQPAPTSTGTTTNAATPQTGTAQSVHPAAPAATTNENRDKDRVQAQRDRRNQRRNAQGNKKAGQNPPGQKNKGPSGGSKPPAAPGRERNIGIDEEHSIKPKGSGTNMPSN